MRGNRKKQKFEALQKYLEIVGQAKPSGNAYRSFSADEALRIVIPFLPLGLLLQALQTLQEVSYDTGIWSDIVSRLPDKLQSQTLLLAKSIEDDQYRTEALINLASRWPTLQLEVLQEIQEIEDRDLRNRALVELMIQVPDDLSQALQALEEIKSEYYYAEALENLIPKLPNNLLPQALQIAQEIEHKWDRDRVLSKLVSRLPNNLLSQALKIIQEDSNGCEEALSKLVLRLPRDLLPQALQATQKLENWQQRTRVLEKLAPRLSVELLPQALQIVREIEGSWGHDEALFTLASYLPGSLSLQALQMLQEVEWSGYRAEVLIKIAPQLPKYLLPQALKIAHKIEDEYWRVYALGNLALYFPEVRSEVLEVVKKIRNKQDRAENLRNLALLFPELWPEALQTARKIKNRKDRAYALGQLTSEFPEMWPEAIQTARKIKDRRTRIDALRNLAAKAPETFLAQALQVTQEILREYSPQEYQRARLLRKATKFYYESCRSVRNIKSSGLALVHASAFINLAAQLLTQRPQVRQISREIESGYDSQLSSLSRLAVHIPEELLPQALLVAQEIEDKYYRAKALFDLSRRFPKLLPEAFRAAQDIEILNDLSISLISLALNNLSVLPLGFLRALLQKLLFTDQQGGRGGGKSPEREYDPIIKTELIQRYIDYKFLDFPAENVLQVGQCYQLEIAVRETPNGIPTDENVRRSIREPRQQSPVTIWVTAESDSDKFEIAEPLQTLELPPKGDSTQNAVFQVRPIQQSVNAENLSKIRIRAYYKFNLLEVAIIQAEVVGKFDDPSHSRLGLENPITFKQERLEREYLDFDDIESREMHVDIRKQNDNFVFNFLFSNESSQRIEFTAPICIPALDLEDALLNVRKLWHDIAMSKTFTTQLEGDDDEFLENIQKLAEVGRNKLWVKLFKNELDSAIFKIGQWLEEHPLKAGSTIQVSQASNAADFVFPWALLYDQKLPRKAYEMPDLEGFWGLRYCIEQRLTIMTDQATQASEKIKLGFMLWEQFRNAAQQKLLMNHLVAERQDTLEVTIPPINEVDDFFDLLDDDNCQILYFYTHGYTRHRKADVGTGKDLDLFINFFSSLPDKDPRLDIEGLKKTYQAFQEGKFELDRSWIELSYGKLYLDQLYDEIDEKLKSHPLVFLNMCESAQVTPSLADSFIDFFLDRGAVGVIGTECSMSIEFAHPFAEKFLTAVISGDKVGHALLDARRYFLVDCKNPLGLAYTLFGSATTCFPGTNVQCGTAVDDRVQELY